MFQPALWSVSGRLPVRLLVTFSQHQLLFLFFCTFCSILEGVFMSWQKFLSYLLKYNSLLHSAAAVGEIWRWNYHYYHLTHLICIIAGFAWCCMFYLWCTMCTVMATWAMFPPAPPTGPEGISSRLLKSCADQLCRIVDHIFSMSQKLGKAPAWFQYQRSLTLKTSTATDQLLSLYTWWSVVEWLVLVHLRTPVCL